MGFCLAWVTFFNRLVMLKVLIDRHKTLIRFLNKGGQLKKIKIILAYVFKNTDICIVKIRETRAWWKRNQVLSRYKNAVVMTEFSSVVVYC